MPRLLAVLGFCLVSLVAGNADAAKRVAFVAGIDAYDHLPAEKQLRKAVNDARAMSEALAGLGYEVQTAVNTGRLDLIRQWQIFLNKLEPGDEAAVFFAGHGVEIDGQNYLMPRDIPLIATGEEEVLKASGLSVASMVDQVRDRRPQVALYVLDACRDNPFRDSKGRSIGGTRGLTRMEPPSGTFIMFSAGATQSALDRLSDSDADPNSVYTRTLLPRLKTPGSIADIARDVRREVRELAASVAHVQTPAYYDEVVGEFCPAGCESAVAAVAAAEPVKPVPAPSVQPAQPMPMPAPQAETAAPEAPLAPAATPVDTTPITPIKTAHFTPRTVAPPGPGRPPIHDCDRLAASSENPDAVDTGPDVVDDAAPAVAACKQAMEAHPGERRFAFQLASAHLADKHPEFAKPLLESLHRDGYPIATTYYGLLHMWGQGVTKNPAEAVRLYREASAQGDRLGTYLIGLAYKDGEGVEKDGTEAVSWLRKAVDMGSAPAMLTLGDAYAQGELGLPKDGVQAADWYAKAAQAGNINGLYFLALLYRDGLGVPKDAAEAERLFAEADTQKNAQAMSAVGGRFTAGLVVAKDEEEARKWYKKAAAHGYRDANWLLGLSYRYGDNKDVAQAAHWYRQGAEAGDVFSMRSVAAMYEQGEGVAKDGAEAVRWYRRAADTGDADAMKSLGKIYEAGDIVAKDDAEAARWYEQAANAGDAAAKASLANIPGKQNKLSAVRSFGPQPHSPVWLAYAPEGNPLYVLFSGGYFHALDPESGALGAEYGASSDKRPCCQLAVSRDGKYLASGSYANLAMLWDAKTGALVKTFAGHSDHVETVALSPDGTLLASSGDDKTLKIWNVESGALLHTLDQAERVNVVAFSPDGSTVAAGDWAQKISLWDAKTGASLAELSGHKGMVRALAFTHDGTHLLSASSDATVKVWDVATRKELRTFGEGFSTLHSLAISPDDTLVATGAYDGSGRLWNLETGVLVATFDRQEEIDTLAFSPDGSTLAAGTGDKMVVLWDVKPAVEAKR